MHFLLGYLLLELVDMCVLNGLVFWWIFGWFLLRAGGKRILNISKMGFWEQFDWGV